MPGVNSSWVRTYKWGAINTKGTSAFGSDGTEHTRQGYTPGKAGAWLTWSLPERELDVEISEALSGLRGVGLQHEGSFIATQDRTGQDSLPDPRADKSHGRYLVSWLSRGWRGDGHERFLRFTSTPLAELPTGLGKLASF